MMKKSMLVRKAEALTSYSASKIDLPASSLKSLRLVEKQFLLWKAVGLRLMGNPS
jgi:hypothetical protein